MTRAVGPEISVTTVLHNSEEGLAACLRAVRPELESGFAELIAVDNDSPDRSVAVVEREAPGARIVRSAENRGFAGGANLAWAHVRGRYWMLLNPDVTLDAGGLRHLVAWMDAHPRVGVASPELRDREGRGPPAAGRALPSPARVLLEASRVHLLLPRRSRARILRGAYWLGGDQVDAGWVPGTALVARSEAVAEAGVLDERFFLYGEDIEWCWRMRRSGWRVGVCSSVVARHDEGSSATRTFGSPDVDRRMVEGELDAVRVMKGERSARRYARATALALAIEAHHPRRDPERRRTAHKAAGLWRAESARDHGRHQEYRETV